VFIAWALEKDEAAIGKHRRIATDRWKFLQPHFKEDTASVDGESMIYGIEVSAAPEPSPIVNKQPFALAKFCRWIEQYVADEKAGKNPRGGKKALAAAQQEFPGVSRNLVRVEYKKLTGRGRGKKEMAEANGG
jgi:hypothetical protein